MVKDSRDNVLSVTDIHVRSMSHLRFYRTIFSCAENRQCDMARRASFSRSCNSVSEQN